MDSQGTYTFRWEHPEASEVFVTGDFDGWSKSIQLDKADNVFEKTVPLKKERHQYKFVVDGVWKENSSAKTLTDDAGNVNNVIDPEDVKEDTSAAMMSSVGAGASTTAMAGAQPKESEKEQSSPTPGAFPETPALDSEDRSFSVNPIPASSGNAPATSNTIESTVHDDQELKSQDQGEQTFGVNPIPASSSMGNPIQLAPGEKVPDLSKGRTVEDTARSDPASYGKSDAQPPSSAPGTQFTADQAILNGPGPVIPESSMPMGNTTNASNADIGPMMSSAGADSSTAQLAGQVPKEPRGVPEVVSDSQHEAHVDPEASGNPEAVEEKKEMEKELQKTVSQSDEQGEPAPSAEDSSQSGDGAGAKAAAGVAAAGAGVAGAAVAANELVKDKTGKDPESAMPESVQETVDEKAKESSIPQQATTTSDEPAPTDAARETTTTVPSGVTESQDKAGFEHEAAGSPDAVKEKAAMEDELLQKVPESEAQGEPAPVESAAVAATAPTATTESSAVPTTDSTAATASPIGTTLPYYGEPRETASTEPMTTTTSSTGAPQLGDPTAGVAPISMESKSAGDSALKAPAEPETATTTDDSALNASAESEAKAPTDKLKENEPPQAEPPQAEPPQAEPPQAMDSRDVSPMSKQPTMTQSQPEATTGVASAAVPRKNEPSASTPQKRQSWFGGKGTPESTRTTETTDSKKDKRRSFFGKIKDKLKS
ncbi:Cruciform DNA binding protein [Saxophila tyrrhenica]|uniref:Cruciform DNA binding protein n=1 Tax=Saxophila tyrrhenica TaxID=1690608 RepID=A0AAV9P0G5_9PEZI|nr:Cruciform DNA binding protein [Saxophila tyrrhenica]